MSKNIDFFTHGTMLFAAVFVMSLNSLGQSDEKKEKIAADALEAKTEFIKADANMADHFYNSYECA